MLLECILVYHNMSLKYIQYVYNITLNTIKKGSYRYTSLHHVTTIIILK